jgi:hypothetical protein
MDTPDSEYLLMRLRYLANQLRQPGAAKWDSKWDSLKEYLIRTPKFKFVESYLDDNRTQITELCLQCIVESLSAVPSLVPAIQQTSAMAQGAVVPSVFPENQPNRLVPSKKAQVDDGFIRIPNKTDPVGARFSYSNKDYSRISRDFVDREGLLPPVGENKMVTLVFWLHDLRPKKSYKIEFKVQKQAQFDVSLGKNWNQEKWNIEEESAGQNLSTLTIRRPSPGTSDLSIPPTFTFLTYIPIVPTTHAPTTTTTKLDNDVEHAVLVLANATIQRHLNPSRLPNPSGTSFVPVAPTGLRHEALAGVENGSHLARKNPPAATLNKLDSAEDSGGRGLDEMPSLTEDGSDNNSDHSPSDSSSAHRVYTGACEERKSLEDQHYDDPFANPWADS